jgi:hypothetical protein
MHKLLSQIAFHQAKIKLLINPNEEDHQVLIEKMNNIGHHVFGFKGMPVEQVEELVEIAQKILKREWERVKKAS